MTRIVARLCLDTLLVAGLLFLGAGTVAWSRAWALLSVMLCIRIVSAVIVHGVHPALLHERAGAPLHREQSSVDRMLVLAILATGFLGLPSIAALDVSRWHAFLPPSAFVSGTGLVLFALGWIVKGAALYANAFATSMVRVQRERAQTVAETGLYAYVRHPFYAADPLIFVGLGLWLQSMLAVALAIVPVMLMLVRLRTEERLLARELTGYAEYMVRVPYRLLPGIW